MLDDIDPDQWSQLSDERAPDGPLSPIRDGSDPNRLSIHRRSLIGVGVIWFRRPSADIGAPAFIEFCSVEFVLSGRPVLNRLVIPPALTK